MDPKAIDHNLSCVNIQRQVSVMNGIDATSITDQLKYVTDHEALSTINDLYFQQFPINIPFLTADFSDRKGILLKRGIIMTILIAYVIAQVIIIAIALPVAYFTIGKRIKRAAQIN